MMKLAPYPEYKDAGVSWVGSIPAHWPEKRAKYYFKEIDDRSQTGDEEMLSVSHITGVTPRSQKNVTMFKAESNVGQKRCKPGDLIINTMWAWMSALGVSNHAGIVSPAYGVYRPRSNQDYDYYYLDSLLRIEGYRSEYICRSTGIRSSRLRLYPDKFLSMPVVCPPQEEQQTIARFLKAQDRLFRKFIRNKRRFIELLKEQKQNIINQAVTRGLDPNVKFKPSGVEWIGDIPEHWKMVPLKRLASFKGGTGFPHEAQGRSGLELPFYKVSDMTLSGNETYMVNTNNSISRETASSLGATIFPERAIIFPKVGGAMLTNKRRILTKPSCIDNNMMACVLNSETIFDFLFLRLQTLDLGLIRKPGPVPAIGEGEVRAFRVPYPPEEEQFEIVEYVKAQTSAIDQTITRAQREIELMREYRTRLISDVVTGQVDVRGIEVPDVAEDELLALEEDTIDADDVIDDEGEMDETD
jgi:type I restriction enzyme S subunit